MNLRRIRCGYREIYQYFLMTYSTRVIPGAPPRSVTSPRFHTELLDIFDVRRVEFQQESGLLYVGMRVARGRLMHALAPRSARSTVQVVASKFVARRVKFMMDKTLNGTDKIIEAILEGITTKNGHFYIVDLQNSASRSRMRSAILLYSFWFAAITSIKLMRLKLPNMPVRSLILACQFVIWKMAYNEESDVAWRGCPIDEQRSTFFEFNIDVNTYANLQYTMFRLLFDVVAVRRWRVTLAGENAKPPEGCRVIEQNDFRIFEPAPGVRACFESADEFLRRLACNHNAAPPAQHRSQVSVPTFGAAPSLAGSSPRMQQRFEQASQVLDFKRINFNGAMTL